jgi:hypothetical protein
LLILVVGGVMLMPIMMAFDFEPMPGDFTFVWNHQQFAVPVLWSFCTSAGLALLYSILKG